MAILLDGREAAETVLKGLDKDLRELSEWGVTPKLVVILVGENPASQVYVRKKEEACQRVGILSERVLFPETVTQEELLKKIQELNEDTSVHGVIVQLPLPEHIEAPKIIKAIDPYKDVDGFHAYNLGKMFLSSEFEDLAPCTPKGIIALLDHYNIEAEGLHVVVVGRSNIVGKPIATMLLNRNATVTICHSYTKNLKYFTSQADLLIAAVGKKELITEKHIKKGAIVIDVGIHRLENGKLMGDVCFDAVEPKASAITPVPGGVGPLTVACLLSNTVTAAKKAAKL